MHAGRGSLSRGPWNKCGYLVYYSLFKVHSSSIVLCPVFHTLLYTIGGEGWRRFTAEYQSGIVWWHFPEVPATSNVRIDLSEDSGSTWRTIVTSTANDGNERWPVPGAGHSTSTARIRGKCAMVN